VEDAAHLTAAASRPELFRSCCHRAFRAGALCRRLAALRQHLFELLLAERVGGGARPEFPQRMPIARAPARERERVARRRVAGVTPRTWRSPWGESLPDAGNSKCVSDQFTAN
jgi:hypothetical protein